MDADLVGIAQLMRRHIEIRNRTWMRRVHRDCFSGSDGVDFLVAQGFADSRQAAVELGIKMSGKKLIRNITDKRKFSDSLHYYRFADDDTPHACLAQSKGGNDIHGSSLGHGGCRWSFAPHTAHNSYILDIGLAEEIERAVAGASIEARALAINKLRSRVREQASADAPNWDLTQTTQVNNIMINVYTRKRPRGDWKNVKLTGAVAESPVGFIRSILNFEKRRQWESLFEDGVIVEGIDIGETPSILLLDEEKANLTEKMEKKRSALGNLLSSAMSKLTTTSENTNGTDDSNSTIPLPESAWKQTNPNIARKTDDVYAFLQTVDLAGIPDDMAIAFLNDPERQHALAYLRKQMMLSNPQECMLCKTGFEDPTDIRFCPCCAMVSCTGCVSKRVFEVVSRNVVSVCVHCYRESSRIFQPPQAVQDQTNIDESLRGKWWRPEELGLVDYSSGVNTRGGNARESVVGPSIYNEEDKLVMTANLRPLIPGLLDDLDPSTLASANGEPSSNVDASTAQNDANTHADRFSDDDGGIFHEDTEATHTSSSALGSPSPAASSVPQPQKHESVSANKTARCKSCGLMISRDMHAIEAHMEECSMSHSPNPAANRRRASMTSVSENKTFTISPDSSSISVTYGNHKQFAGIARKHDVAAKNATRIIYRTARSSASGGVAPREVCALQDSFLDEDGTAYLYEVSVRHSEVHGIADYVTSDVMLSLHVARPIKGNKTASAITIISQVDPHTKGGSSWFGDDLDAHAMAGLRQEDLVRELKLCGDLPNLLATGTDAGDEDQVSLDDFELLAVLGRGGFGKVMQVRHRESDTIYAMKILKKSELRRLRQVERTQTERTILANVNHPFIVRLYYAFQNAQKLYMVMDFVQGGDLFTLMLKFRRLSEDWVQLYILQIAMALQHLHDRDIVYRDLKLENVLVCADGYLKLTDFGLSRYFETRPPEPEAIVEGGERVTRSFCGTEQYMSPEMLLQQGHNYRMDWWCLGLLMHEMITGKHPFRGANHYETLRNMVTRPPNLDSRLSTAATVIVRSLLVKNPRARLGGKEGLAELQNIAYFNSIDWEDLYHKRIEMPHKPVLNSETDISSFDTTFTKQRAVDSVPGPGPTAADEKKKPGIISSLFGLGTKQTTVNDDAFKGFSFTKPEEVPSQEQANTPPQMVDADDGGIDHEE